MTAALEGGEFASHVLDDNAGTKLAEGNILCTSRRANCATTIIGTRRASLRKQTHRLTDTHWLASTFLRLSIVDLKCPQWQEGTSDRCQKPFSVSSTYSRTIYTQGHIYREANAGPLTCTGPFQVPGKSPSNAFTGTHVFVKFEEVRYFTHNQFKPLSVN